MKMNKKDQEKLATPVRFVCVATGDLYGLADVYIDRMFGMLETHMHRPFTLSCVTDRTRNIAAAVEQIPCSSWNEFRKQGSHPTLTKLGLFNPEYVPFEDFIYFDLSLVIRSNLEAFLDYTSSREEALVIVKDWYYDGFNSSVMRIRNRPLRFIYEEFAAGKEYPAKIPGDQDYITASMRSNGVAAACFPADMVASFKMAIRLGFTQPLVAARQINAATIVKFHGNPKMHRLFSPTYRFLKYGLRYALRGQFSYPFSIQELALNWTAYDRTHGNP